MQSFALLFQIENLLRAFIRTRLEDALGPRWFKGRLPSDLLVKYKEALDWERQIPWQQLLPHHPLFYLDFPDLRKVIDRKDNWTDAFAAYFGDKTIFLGHLAALDPTRNRVAHNRYCQSIDVERLEVALSMIQEGIGRFGNPLRTDPLIGVNISERLNALADEATELYQEMNRCKLVSAQSSWQATHHQWWFDSDFLPIDTAPVEIFYALVAEYQRQPRLHGQGYLIERWLKTKMVCNAFDDCMTEFKKCCSKP